MSDSVLPPHDSLGAQGAHPDSGRPGSTPTYETYDPENMVAEGYVPFQAPPAEFHTNFPGNFANGVNILTPEGGANATWPPQQTPQWWPSAPSSAPMHTPVHPGLAHGPMSFQQAINSTTPTHEHTAMPGAHQLPPTHWPDTACDCSGAPRARARNPASTAGNLPGRPSDLRRVRKTPRRVAGRRRRLPIPRRLRVQLLRLHCVRQDAHGRRLDRLHPPRHARCALPRPHATHSAF